MPFTARKEFRSRVLAQKTVWAAGAYDALSARFIQGAGFDALLTSGFGVSASLPGMPDAELYTMTENVGVVRNVTSVVDIPVVADIDTAYGNAINVMRTIREFEAAGVAAVIMEDQVAPKRCPILASVVELGRSSSGNCSTKVSVLVTVVPAATVPKFSVPLTTETPGVGFSVSCIVKPIRPAPPLLVA